MMDDQDLRNLRTYGSLLRSEIDVAKVVSNVMDRVRTAPTVTNWLAQWLRPLATAAALATVLTGAVVYRESRSVPDLVASAETSLVKEMTRALP
jgi:hypothetical protein